MTEEKQHINIFERIYHDKLERFYVRAQRKYQALFNSEGGKRIQERMALEVELRKEADECRDLFKDSRYPGQAKFLNHIESEMTRILRQINAHDKTREGMVLDSARLAYGLELIDQIRNRPLEVIDTLEKLEEELKKRKEGGSGYA